MNVGGALSAVKNGLAAHPRAVKIGAAGAGLVGVAGIVSACTNKPPTDAATVASNEFHEFDSNRDGSISPEESRLPKTRTWTSDQVTVRVPLGRGDYMESGITYTYQQRYERTIDKIRSAAGGEDAIASWKEIGDFGVANFDRPDKNGVKDGLLDGKEQKAFRKEYGVDEVKVGNPEVIATTPYVRTWHDYTYSDDDYSYDRGSDYDPGPVYDSGADYDPGPVYDSGY